MARAVLTTGRAILLGLAATCAGAAGAAQSRVHPSPCPQTIQGADPVLQRSYLEFAKSVESSPMLRFPGRPRSCTARLEGGSIRIKYSFARGGELEAHRDPAIELTEQRLDWPGLSEANALDLLRRTERWAFGKGGCGIPWKKSPTKDSGAAPGDYERAFQGTDCNCQARLLYSDGRLRGLAFRSVC